MQVEDSNGAASSYIFMIMVYEDDTADEESTSSTATDTGTAVTVVEETTFNSNGWNPTGFDQQAWLNELDLTPEEDVEPVPLEAKISNINA